MTNKPWLLWNNADSRILEAALGLALLLVGLVGAVLPILGVTGLLSPAYVRAVELGDLAQVPGIASAGGVALRGTHTAELVFADPGIAERLLLVLPDLVRTLLVLVVLELLRRIARSLRDGDVFVVQNARRLTVVALAVLVFGTVAPLVEAVTTLLLVNGTDLGTRIPFTYSISGACLLLVLLIAAAAEAFRQGARLRADTVGLV